MNIRNLGDTSGIAKTIGFNAARQLAWESGTFVVEGRLILSFEELEELILMPDYREKDVLQVLAFEAVAGG